MDLTARPFEETIGDRDLAQWKSPPGRLLARLILAASKWTTWRWVMIALIAVGALGAFLTAIVFGELYEMVRDQEWMVRFDRSVLDWAIERRPAWAATAVTWFTTIGGPVVTPILVAVSMGLLSWRWKSWTPIVLAGLAGIGSLAITIAGKLLIARHRPPLSDAIPPFEHSFSFPSGHAMNATVLSGMIAYILLTRVRHRAGMVSIVVAAGLYSLLMGLSRVYLGHHWLSDVISGWVLGAGWIVVMVVAHRLHLTHHRYHRQLEEAADVPSPEELGEAKPSGTVQ
ncbi:phosphatase PAP2 family protein [Aestuariimicrobium ganziense]|uniref:phosphatase PAP2 family protein n=1 Tax=Aestuariimicrobium ganziense TaxID=2773677 RepID=UPI001943A4B6|nr:phosphatase PAP2 family protein [Aestuariimicrobium ganziense]